jgi:hypothetical protein
MSHPVGPGEMLTGNGPAAGGTLCERPIREYRLSGLRAWSDRQGARVAALAEAGEVLMSCTVKDLINGSGIAFQERGTRMLKGVPRAVEAVPAGRPTGARRSPHSRQADVRPSAAVSPRLPSRRRILAHASVDGFSKQVGMSGVAAVLLDQVA